MAGEARLGVERLALYPEKEGICGVREATRVYFNESAPAILDHIHTNAMEICYFYRGGQTYHVGKESYTVGAGEIFLTYPNEIHSTNSLGQEKDGVLYYFILDTVTNPEHFLGLPGEEGLTLARGLEGMQRSFYVGYEVRRHLDVLFTEKSGAWGDPLSRGLLRSHLCLLFHAFLEASGMAKRGPSDDVCRVVNYLDHHLDHPPSVAQMARLISCSEPYFKQKFRREIGLPPAKYLMKKRIERAKELLLEGKDITETAYGLGFSSSQHFTTSFKSYMGLPPKAWLKRQWETRGCS